MQQDKIKLTDVFKGINGWTIIMDWESCPNTFMFESKNYNKTLEIHTLLNNRLNNYLNNRKSFITSDIKDLQYVKK